VTAATAANDLARARFGSLIVTRKWLESARQRSPTA